MPFCLQNSHNSVCGRYGCDSTWTTAGLILAASVSHWEDQSSAGVDVQNYPGNAILAQAGILWTDVDVQGSADGAYAVRQEIPAMASAAPAFVVIRALRDGTDPETIEDQLRAPLDEFKVPYDVRVMSAHRTPEVVRQYAAEAASRELPTWAGAARTVLAALA